MGNEKFIIIGGVTYHINRCASQASFVPYQVSHPGGSGWIIGVG